MRGELEGQGLLPGLPGQALVAAGRPEGTHLTQPVAPGTSESGLSTPTALLSGLGVITTLPCISVAALVVNWIQEKLPDFSGLLKEHSENTDVKEKTLMLLCYLMD